MPRPTRSPSADHHVLHLGQIAPGGRGCKFETGKSYLIAASDGGVLICGYSGEADSPGLRELYERAF